MLDIHEALEQYVQLVLETNKYINLTSITDFNEALVLHLEDSLAGLPFIQSAPEGKYIDLGTGGGFPGVPLAFASQRNTTLVDSVAKKLTAIQNIVEQIDYPHNISYCHSRIEDLAILEKELFSVATARALSSLPSLLELASPLIKNGGLLICYKAHVQDELKRAQTIVTKLGFEQDSYITYRLSDGITERSLVVYKKISESEIALPRKVGLAQKKPLA